MLNPSTINPLTLPSMPLEMRSKLPATSCIYFALDSFGQVQYVGRSVNLRQRWLAHHRQLELEAMGFVSIAWLEVSSPDLLIEVEKALIDWFNPPLNGALLPRSSLSEIEITRRLHCRLAVLMAERDPQMSQRELADKSGVSTMAVNRLYRNDFKRVDTETIEKLCEFFRCDLSDLLVLREADK